MINSKYKAFSVTADYGSFTKAAELLNYSPSGVSQLVSALEKEVGFSLLIRTRRGVELTKEGAKLLPAIRASLQQEERLSELISEVNGLSVGEISIGSYTSIACHWLPGLMKEFLKQHPGVNINIIDGIHDDLEEKLNNHTIDLCFFSYKKNMPYDWIPLAKDPMVALLPKTHPKAQNKSFKIADIKNESFIMPHLGRDYDCNELLRKYKVAPSVMLTTMENFTMMSLVESGMGISVLNQLATLNYGVDVVKLPLDPPQYLTYGIAVTSLENASPAVHAFIKFATEHLKDKAYTLQMKD